MVVSYIKLDPNITTILDGPRRAAPSHYPPPVRHLVPRPLRKIKGEMWTIFYVASISIPILDEMVDEMRYEVILLWTAIFNTMIAGEKKEA